MCGKTDFCHVSEWFARAKSTNCNKKSITMSKMTCVNVVVHHFSNFRVTKCVRKTCFQDLPSKTDDPRLRTQFSSLFSRCQGLCTCTIIVFIGKTLPRDFPAQPFPMSKKKKCNALRKRLFHFVFIFLFFFHPEGRSWLETAETVGAGGD